MLEPLEESWLLGPKFCKAVRYSLYLSEKAKWWSSARVSAYLRLSYDDCAYVGMCTSPPGVQLCSCMTHSGARACTVAGRAERPTRPLARVAGNVAGLVRARGVIFSEEDGGKRVACARRDFVHIGLAATR